MLFESISSPGQNDFVHNEFLGSAAPMLGDKLFSLGFKFWIFYFSCIRKQRLIWFKIFWKLFQFYPVILWILLASLLCILYTLFQTRIAEKPTSNIIVFFILLIVLFLISLAQYLFCTWNCMVNRGLHFIDYGDIQDQRG